MIPIVAIDFGCGLGRQALKDACEAISYQAQQHFALPPPYGYGISAVVRLGASSHDVRPHEWLMGLFPSADIAGALGYHDQTTYGQPLAKVFPLLESGSQWSVTMSHELLEMLADPNISRCSIAEDGQIWAYEVCDACEAQTYGVHVSSGAIVQVSDFVLPPYFEPVTSMHGLKRDWMGLIKHPLEILSGGYGQTYDPNTGWKQHDSKQAAKSPYRKAMADLGVGRGARRQRGLHGKVPTKNVP